MEIKTQSSSSTKLKPARKRYSDKERIKHVRAWERSGLSGTEYARKINLSTKSLYTWRSKFAQSASNDTGIDNSESVFEAPSFVSVSVPGISTLKVSVHIGQMQLRIESCSSQTELVGLLRALKQEVCDV